MLVEFIGISGSGKSTVARSVTRILEADGLVVRHIGSGYEWVEGSRLRATLRDAAAGGVRAVLRTAQLASAVNNAGRVLRPKERLSLLSLLGQNARALQFRSGLVLSDQGLLQRFGSFGLRSDDEARFFEQLDPEKLLALPWPHRVVFLELEPRVAFERVKARGGRMARVSDYHLRVLLKRSETIVEAQAQLAARLSIPVERVSADTTPEVLAQKVRRKLAQPAETGA